MTENSVIVIVGPTAVGKTELSLQLAEQVNGEIVSADSRQVYRYMNIGTAKPTIDELDRVPHHFIDIKNPDEYYSAGEYGREARAKTISLRADGKRPIIVGGSGFYIRALVDGLSAPKDSDPAIKKKWQNFADDKGNDYVFDYLKRIDPVSAKRLHPNDTQRIVRAIEVFEISGIPISSFKQGEDKSAPFEFVFVGLERPRVKLYERINDRVDVMIKDGLVEEVESLRERGYSAELNALRTVGYQEVFSHFDGELTFDEMVDKIKMNSRRYAKRQLTWFRKDERIKWFDVEQKSVHTVLKEIIKDSPTAF